MDVVARVESRIFDLQARFARFGGVTTAPASASAKAAASNVVNGGGEAGASVASFRDLANAAYRSLATDTTGATGASSTSTVRSATRAPGTFGALTLPKSLTGLTNGQLPDAVLEPIGQGNHRLEHRAALAFRRMADAAAQEGVQLKVSDSYRSLADQTRTAGDVGLYRDGGLAAVPGTSTHGWGLSVDLETDPKVTQWLRANASRFGFAEDVAREPWHYTYRPADL